MAIKILKTNNGFSVVELMVVIAIIVTTFVSLLGMISFSLGISALMKQTLQANNMAQETLEAVRNFRDGTDWETTGLGILGSGDYHPEICSPISSPPCDPSKWQLISNAEIIGIFTRKVVFQTVRRETDGDIVETGGNLDSNTKKAIVTVSWQEKNRNHQVEIATYLTNW